MIEEYPVPANLLLPFFVKANRSTNNKASQSLGFRAVYATSTTEVGLNSSSGA